MRNEWRSNVWIITELVVVSGVLWFIFLFLGLMAHMRMQKYGYDTSDLCMAYIHRISSSSSSYAPYSEGRDESADLQLLTANLRGNSFVEEVGVGINIIPYEFNYFGQRLNTMVGDSLYTYNVNTRTMTPDVVRLLRIEGRDGETPEQIASVLERGELVVAEPTNGTENWPDILNFVGRETFTNDTSRLTRVGALAYGLHRSDYEDLWAGVLYQPLSMYFPQDMAWFPTEILVRVKPGKADEFIASLTPADKRTGNVYLGGLQTLDKKKAEIHFQPKTYIRNFSAGALFLFIIIFLGFLGTFWFRLQQRVGEIAIRKVNGATRADIFRRLIGEGMILLIVATLIAIPLELILAHYGIIPLEKMLGSNCGTVRFESMAVTFLTLAVMIVGGMWFPARKAMKVNPATALKDL